MRTLIRDGANSTRGFAINGSLLHSIVISRVLGFGDASVLRMVIAGGEQSSVFVGAIH
jgi:hypothetical protein